MSKKSFTAAVAFALVMSSVSLASAQTTLAGGKKDNSASGGSENGDAKEAGKTSPGKTGSMMKSTKVAKPVGTPK